MIIWGVFSGMAWLIYEGKFTPEVEQEPIIRLAAAGDVIAHLPIVRASYLPESQSYDFRPCFREVQDYLSGADVAVAVLETVLAGEGETDFLGYPKFKTPPIIADALQWAGIDLVFTAHNHSLDHGEKGIEDTNAYLNRLGLLHTGCPNNGKEPPYQVIEKNGMKLAFFSYTTLINGLSKPKQERSLVNVLDFENLEQTIVVLRAQGIDGIVLALHTGEEYQREPSERQRQIVKRLLAIGVDVVLGSHVHVVQPYEFHQIMQGVNGAYKTSFVAYSLGNFLSNQQWQYSDSGLMVLLELRKNPFGPGLDVKLIDRSPIWVHRFLEKGRYAYRIRRVTEHSEGSAETVVEQLDSRARERMKQVWQETEAVCGSLIIEK